MGGLVKINKLRPGDTFIWADKYTRRYMVSDDPGVHRTHILTFVEHLSDRRFTFSVLDSEDTYHIYHMCYDHLCLVYRIEGGKLQQKEIDYGICCVRCGNHYGSHLGMHCGDNQIFMPDQDRASEPDWLSVELGL